MLGFVCHLRGTDQLLLLTNLHSRSAAVQLQQHPALALLAQQPARVAAVVHLAAPGVAGSRALRQLCRQLRPAVQGPAGGQQLMLEQPGAHGSGQVCAVKAFCCAVLAGSCTFRTWPLSSLSANMAASDPYIDSCPTLLNPCRPLATWLLHAPQPSSTWSAAGCSLCQPA